MTLILASARVEARRLGFSQRSAGRLSRNDASGFRSSAFLPRRRPIQSARPSSGTGAVCTDLPDSVAPASPLRDRRPRHDAEFSEWRAQSRARARASVCHGAGKSQRHVGRGSQRSTRPGASRRAMSKFPRLFTLGPGDRGMCLDVGAD